MPTYKYWNVAKPENAIVIEGASILEADEMFKQATGIDPAKSSSRIACQPQPPIQLKMAI